MGVMKVNYVGQLLSTLWLILNGVIKKTAQSNVCDICFTVN